MPPKRIRWLIRIKTVEREHSVIRLATDRLLEAVRIDSTLLDPELAIDFEFSAARLVTLFREIYGMGYRLVQLIAVATTFLLIWCSSIPLGVPGEWTWTRSPVADDFWFSLIPAVGWAVVF